MDTSAYVAREDKYLARNYKSFPFILNKAEGVWLWDTDGKKYLDMVAAYSAVSFGHLNPRIHSAITNQLGKMDVQARAFRHDLLGEFAEKLCKLTGLDRMLPMNTGAEAVETAIKAARRWGFEVKGIADGQQRIIACENNFHGRTTTIIGMSSDADYRRGFGPFDGGCDLIPHGDAAALEKAITPDACAFIVEPIQGEGGILVPPAGYLKEIQAICKKHNVLLILDEVQTGMGRTGKDFAFQHEIDKPDGLILGKALGGGIYPVSAFLGTEEVMNVFDPGSHGSTFGGNAIASAVAIAAMDILTEEKLSNRSAELGDYLLRKLQGMNSPAIKEVRGRGLLIGLETNPEKITAPDLCKKLLDKGIMSKDTHGTTIRFSPPLTIEKEQIDWAVEQLADIFREV